MVNIEILNVSQADDSFFSVHVTEGSAPQCFLEGTNVLPNTQGGFDLLVDHNEPRALQKAGRLAGGLGLQKVKVSVDDSFNLNALSAVQFVLGMYSEDLERRGMTVAFDLNEAEVKAVRRDVEFLTLARIFANSPNNLYHTKDLLTTFFAELEKTFRKVSHDLETTGRGYSAGSLTFTLYEAGDLLFDKECIGLQAVGNSSAHAPCLGVIDYVGPHADPNVVDIALVGKGIAFDTGGNNIKTGKFMDTMRTDKTGLITVAAATVMAGAMGADKHIRCYMPCAENMVSGSAMVPGDILHYPNGVSVEIANTDAEGRLVLADALLLASKDKPKFILDAATLTGAAKIAVGRDICAALCRENVLDEQLAQAYAYTGEEIWLLPMREYHKRYITARRADIANSSHGDGAPGSSTAAAFLSFFVDSKTPWTHLDLSNAFQCDASPYYAPGSTGANVYSLAHWLVGSSF